MRFWVLACARSQNKWHRAPRNSSIYILGISQFTPFNRVEAAYWLNKSSKVTDINSLVLVIYINGNYKLFLKRICVSPNTFTLQSFTLKTLSIMVRPPLFESFYFYSMNRNNSLCSLFGLGLLGGKSVGVATQCRQVKPG